MSWQDMITNNLIGSNFVSKAAICGLDGSVWAKSDNFNLESSEINSAIKGFQQSEVLLSQGLMLEKQKYFVLQADGERIIGKKGPNGFFVYKTKTACVLAVYENGIQPEMCSKASGALADYLIKSNY